MHNMNAEVTGSLFGEDYHKCFDPEEFLKFRVFVLNHEQSPMKFIVQSLCDIFSKGLIGGKTMVEIGSGPSIYGAICAASWIDEITLSDYTETNRTSIKKWLEKEPPTVDHKEYFDYVCEILEPRKQSEDLEKQVRSKIKAVLPCDVTQPHVLYSQVNSRFDVVMSLFCLEIAVTAHEHFCQAVKRLAVMLNDGGLLILGGTFNETFYVFNGKSFSTLPVTKESVSDALVKAGLCDEDWRLFNGGAPPGLSNCDDFFVVTGRKRKDTC